MATRMIEARAVEACGGVEDWLERDDQAIKCAMIQHSVACDQDKKNFATSLLLSSIGQSGCKVIKSYCAAQKPSELEYSALVKD